jgi:ferredoxin-NADP reductase
VRVGDVLRCGGVVAQVCQPRLPCARLDARTGRRFAGRFLRSRRVGFFARVLTPGAIAAGDPIELVRRDGGEPSIDDLLRLTQLEAWDAEGLAHLLLSRHLPAAWRELIEHKAELAQRAEGWHGLRPLELVERRVEAPDVASLWLACPYRRPLPPYRPGQYLTVTWRLEPEDGALRRSYVLTGEPERADRYRITVARTAPGPHPPGVVSTAMLDELAPGARLLAAAPRGSFTLDEVTASSRGVLVLSEGIGVASALPLLRERRRRLPEVPAVHLHVDRDPARFALQDELAALDEPAGESPSFAPARRLVFGHEPAPPAALLRKLVAAAEHVFLAGPKSFTEEVTAALEGLVELVHGAPDAALGGKAAGARLRVESHG